MLLQPNFQEVRWRRKKNVFLAAKHQCDGSNGKVKGSKERSMPVPSQWKGRNAKLYLVSSTSHLKCEVMTLCKHKDSKSTSTDCCPFGAFHLPSKSGMGMMSHSSCPCSSLQVEKQDDRLQENTNCAALSGQKQWNRAGVAHKTAKHPRVAVGSYYVCDRFN